MKTLPIALISAAIFLGSCSNNSKTDESKTTDTLSVVDTVKKDTVKKDTVAVSKPKKQTEEERDMKRMNDILKKRKTLK